MEHRIPRRAVVAGIGAAMLFARAAAQDGFRTLRAAPGGFDGAVPGPVLRIRRGEELKVRLVNDLPVALSLHWHGVRLPNASDGVAGLTQQPMATGASFHYRFTPPDAGTFWYRVPFPTADTRALHGLLIVDEAEPYQVDREVAILLDSATAPDIPIASNERVRVRLINTGTDFTTARIERHPVHVIAIDGQPAEPFAAREGRITLSPGNRADLLVGGEPKPLPPNPLPARMDFRGALRAELDVGTANDSVPAKPLFAVKRGRTVMLAIRNGAAHPAALHIHGHHVRLLDALDDGWKPFWLDTVLSPPQAITRVAYVADNPGKWLLHARAIGADAQSLAWFEVT